MSIQIASLNSGSNGNCYYIGTSRHAVLVDAGLSCRETERRMSQIGLEIRNVRAIFISHEHSDHIRGVEVLSRKHKLPVYISRATHQSSRLFIQAELLRDFSCSVPVEVGGFEVMPFRKSHDAADPYSFVVSVHGMNIGVFTDIGHACQKVTSRFSQCQAAFLEANYDEDMLFNGAYPWHLKRRISSDSGHLSNRQALELFLAHRHADMSHILLAHLSRENNSPQLVSRLFKEHAGNIHVEVASRDYATPVFNLSPPGMAQRSEPAVQLQLDIS